MSATGTILQEMTRIMKRMRGQGVKYAWLSEDNLKAMQTLPGQFAATTQQPAPIQQTPPRMAPSQTLQPSAPQSSTAATQFAAPRQPAIQKPAPVTPPPAARPTPPAIDDKSLADFTSAAKGADWPSLENLSRSCTLCGLANSCKHKLFYAGAPKVRVLFIGDFPTFEEDESGTPFSGQAGQMLFNMGKAMGLNWAPDAQPQLAAGYVNVLKCRPAALPSDMQLAACLPLLHRQIELLSPDTLVLLGAIPTKMLTGKSGFSKLKGTWETYLGLPAAIIQSPSFIVRFAKQQQIFLQERRQAWATLQEVMKSLQLVGGR